MKSLTINKAKLTDLLNGGLVLVSAEEKVDYNDKTTILHHVTMLSIDCNQTITAVCKESLPKDIKAMDKVDCINCEILFKGKGTSVFGTNIIAELVMNITADKVIKAQA